MVTTFFCFSGYHTSSTGEKMYGVEEALQRMLQQNSSDDDNEADEFLENDIDDIVIDDPTTMVFDNSDEESIDDTDRLIESLVADIHEDYNTMKSRSGSEKWYRTPLEQRGRARIHNIIRNQSGPTNNARRHCGSSPEEAFKLFISPSLVQKIVEYTNNEAREHTHSWKKTNIEELYKFFGLLLLSGALHENKTRVADLWSATEGRPIFNDTMARNRFTELLRYLRFDCRSERNSQDKFAPLRQVFEEIVTKFRANYSSGSELTVDEQLVSFRGRCPFKMFIPSKPGRYGIKLWALCDSKTYYCLNLQPYVGRVGDVPERGQGQRVVLQLTDFLTGSGRHIYMDNFFTSLSLARSLLGRQITMTGTIRRNKTELPNEMMPDATREQFTSIFGFQDKVTIVSYVPKKNKAVILLSTNHHDIDISSEESRKPQIILDYNKGKCGVDTLDQLVRNYNCIRKCNRWPLTLFMNLLNICSYNALVLFLYMHPEYEQRSGQVRKRFLLQLSKSLIGCREDATEPARLPLRPINQPVPKQRRCEICPRERDRKSTKRCAYCQKTLCAEHAIIKCLSC